MDNDNITWTWNYSGDQRLGEELMDNGQMARWVARIEYLEQRQAEQRDEAFRRDIRPDDFEMGTTHTTASRPVQLVGGILFLKRGLASLRAKLGVSESQHWQTQKRI